MKRRQDRKSEVTTRREVKSVTRRVMASTARAPKKTSGDKAVGAHKSREVLERDLAAAEAKIRDMEKRLALVTDRIAWIADRLHSILHDEK